MPKVLAAYGSACGDTEAMANAVAEGDRETGAKVDGWRVPETVPEAIAEATHFKLVQNCAGRKGRRLGHLRRDHRRGSNPLWPHFITDGQLL